jgi:hypothetical protein
MSLGKGVFDTLDPSTPRLGTIIIEGSDAGDRLRWNEVCWAASLMAVQAARAAVSSARNCPGEYLSIHELLLALANVALQGICGLHHQNECTCDSSTL